MTIRPAPDTMSNVTGLLPVAQGVAVYAALRQHAKTLRAQGDPRTISQIMADTFFTRLTGQENGVGGVEIQLVMNERTLLRGDHEPAYAPGYGTIPASLARRIVARGRQDLDPPPLHRSGLRRARCHGQQAPHLPRQAPRPDRAARPDLPHSLVRRTRSPTSTTPGRQGAAARRPQPTARVCAKPATTPRKHPGGAADLVRSAGHLVEITTPTGHRYRSSPPRQPGDPPAIPLEERLRRLLDDVA